MARRPEVRSAPVRKLNQEAIEGLDEAERIGIGMQVHHEDVTSDTFRRFLADEVPFREAATRGARDGRVEAIAALEGFARELTVRGSRAAASAWRYA